MTESLFLDLKGTKAWFKKNKVPFITSFSNSPNFLIFESYAYPLKKIFYTRRSKIKEEALVRFTEVFKEMD